MPENIEKQNDAVISKRKGKKRRRGVYKSSTRKLIERILKYIPRDGAFHSASEIAKMVRSDYRCVGNAFNIIKMVKEFPYEIEFTTASTRKHLFMKVGERKVDEVEHIKLLLSKATELLESKEK